MYKYDNYDQTIVDERVKQYREQTQRFLSGTLSEDEFRPLRLMNGLYIQRHAPMLRVAIPYGLLSSKQMKMLGHIAKKYDKGYAHFSTRQNIQYNWPALEDVPDILEELASVQMHAIQTSGNCIRNVSSDHFAGISKDEIEDPRPYCEIIRQWSTFHPEFSYLPRKFKIAVSGSENDRAAVKVHDIGLYLVKNKTGEIGFHIVVGGGLGRTPYIGKSIKPFLEKKHLLSYLEAILRVYNRLGFRDNIYKARIKILVNKLGIEEFTRLVDEEWDNIKNSVLELDQKEIDRVKSFFTSPNYDVNAKYDDSFENHKKTDKNFSAWAKHNLYEHKISGYKAVVLSLKTPDVPPGDITSEQMEFIADIAEQYSYGEIVTTHEQNLVLPNVKQKDLFPLWKKLAVNKLATPNIGLLTDIICCPGLDFCSLANASSIPIVKKINERFDDLDYIYDIGDIKIRISGCINACSHHHVAHIGILGVNKKGEEFYQVTLGGSSGNDISLGDRLGPSFSKTEIIDVISKLVEVYIEQRQENECFIDAYRRIGIKPFKDKVYANN